MEIGIHFGALAPSVSEQVQKQLNYTDAKLLEFDKDANALVRVYMSGIITDGENRKARQRLMKQVTRHLNSLKKSKGE